MQNAERSTVMALNQLANETSLAAFSASRQIVKTPAETKAVIPIFNECYDLDYSRADAQVGNEICLGSSAGFYSGQP